MWKIGSSGGLGHRWSTPNNWDGGEGEEEERTRILYPLWNIDDRAKSVFIGGR